MRHFWPFQFQTLSLLLFLLTGAAIHTTAAPRNVVLFVTDDQSPDMGCYGNEAIHTPNMDELAALGVRFTHAFCTTASCSASRSVILTGLHNHANGHYGHQHSFHKFSSYDTIQSLPVMLSKAGYRTARIGKHHNAPEDVYFFEEKLPGNSRSPVEMANQCKQFITANDDKPFFLYFATSDPHRGGGQAKLPYEPNRFGNKPNRGSYPGVEETFYDPKDVKVPPFLPDTPTCRAEIAQYYQSISRIDQGLGQLVQILKDTQHWDDTLIIFTSDHGMAFPGAKTTLYEGGMRVPFLVRYPGLKSPGTAHKAMISFVDITPTILDWAGALDSSGNANPEIALKKAFQQRKFKEPKPYAFHGRSFLPVIDSQSGATKEATADWDVVYASHQFHEIQMYYPMRVVRQRRYKLIHNIAHPLPFPFASDLWAAPTWQAQYKQGMDAMYGQRTVGAYIQRPKFELFDLEADPKESRNVADEPDYAKIKAELIQEMKQFQKDTDDPWIMKWDYE